jgi:DDE superfamily endonuclease
MSKRGSLSTRTMVDFKSTPLEPLAFKARVVQFPEAERIRVVLDNLSTHFPGSLYQAFSPFEARRVLRRLEFHYVPKHASWLNMVEIEIGVLRSQCLDRRIATQEQLVSEIAAWQRQRNASRARIKWMFTTEKARAKMGRAYPEPASVREPLTKES